MGRKSMKGGSPASRLVMSLVKTADVKCNEKFEASSNTHDVSGGDFYATTGGGRKKKGRRSRGKKQNSSIISRKRLLLLGKNNKNGRKGKRRTRVRRCNGGAKTESDIVVI